MSLESTSNPTFALNSGRCTLRFFDSLMICPVLQTVSCLNYCLKTRIHFRLRKTQRASLSRSASCCCCRLRLLLFFDSGPGGRSRSAWAARFCACSFSAWRFRLRKCTNTRPSPKLMEALTTRRMMLEVSITLGLSRSREHRWLALISQPTTKTATAGRLKNQNPAPWA